MLTYSWLIIKTFPCIVDYYSKFQVVKRVASLSTDDLVHATKMTIAEFGLSKKIISVVGMDFTSETFKEISRKVNIEQSLMSSYHHKSNGQVQACIKFVKCTIKKCIDTYQDINLALLQIWSTLVEAGLPSLALMLFRRPIQGVCHKWIEQLQTQTMTMCI